MDRNEREMDTNTFQGLRTALIVLVCIACVTALAPPATAGTTGDDADDDTYVVTQGDEEFEITPVGDGTQTAEEFYDYRTPETHDYPDYLYSSYGTTEYQKDDASILMLHEGSDGLSLVLVHDKVDGDTRGGSLTMQIDGLPEDGEWVVEDDAYSESHYGGPLDTFDHDDTSSRITWIWTEGRTDGGAFNGGLDDGDWEITIEPYFNEEADYRYEDPEGYDGQLDDWKLISGAGDSHTSTSLPSLDEPITITPGGVPELSVSSLTAFPSTAEPGETVEISTTVTNVGNADGEFEVEFTGEDELIDTETVSLEAGESTQLTTEVTFEEPGSYELGVEGTTTSVQVLEEPSNGVGSENGTDTNGNETTVNGNHSEGNGDETGTQGQTGDDGLHGFGVLTGIVALAALIGISYARRNQL
ncbi:CARDB domain-containing protein [Natranaeroarchaeum sulfidigenes]|uniref:Putative S-layer protein, contains OB-fold domain n=1 Tax=Natranaeroarchaeum sulfidigenes TaxID=2784880 RepID=A0A897MLE9_9EURY|nr:CARDB domain-containing protein [Natranaeroarchaeum sulfidigenes]QSG03010.1 putative S-layer protein, contains OB-fold domain [Natranaeroarchaeum sulfidigenes]